MKLQRRHVSDEQFNRFEGFAAEIFAASEFFAACGLQRNER